jgi:hypothetical protein
MITRNVWLAERARAAEKILRQDERNNTLTLVSWVWPSPKRHPRFWRRLQIEMQFNWIESSKGMVIN